MSKFYNTSRGSVSATIEGEVAVFPPKQWTHLADSLEMSSSLKSLLDQGVLIPGAHLVVSAPATASKPRPSAKKTAPFVFVPAPAKVEAKADAKAEGKTKEDRPLPSSDKK